MVLSAFIGLVIFHVGDDQNAALLKRFAVMLSLVLFVAGFHETFGGLIDAQFGHGFDFVIIKASLRQGTDDLTGNILGSRTIQ